MQNSRTTTAKLTLLSILLAALAMPVLGQQAVDDADIRSAITADYVADDSIPSHRIDVSVNDGVVTLDGSVYNILARDRAIKVAQTIKGVRSVVSQLEISPVERPDQDIRQDIADALLVDPATESYEVSVSVRNGTAILTGEVESYEEKQLCEHVAKGVRGVKSVNNKIDIDYETDRPDHEIVNEVERLLQSDIRVDAENIAVEAKNGKITLSGNVGSAREKDRAETVAWVTGVKKVQNDLAVRWWDREEDLKRSEYQDRTDAEIEKSVRDAFLYDPRVQIFEIEVDAEFGTVTLSGTVDNLAAKKAAEEDAENTVGVWSVINNIDVRPEPYVEDEEIVRRVENALGRDPYVARHDITVTCYNGKVFLHGDVNTEFEKDQAEDAAWSILGVVDVQNNINVRERWVLKTDWEIERDVEDQLFWSPFVDSDEVNVEVENGTVTLTGTVDTWREYTEAAENAYQGGAKKVDNQLNVKEVSG